jgi:hypothetical protein
MYKPFPENYGVHNPIAFCDHDFTGIEAVLNLTTYDACVARSVSVPGANGRLFGIRAI